MAMTVKEHDDNWMAAAKSIQHMPGIADSIRRANAIEILKELYNCGAIDTKDYVDSLVYIAKREGFELDDIVYKKKTGV